VAALASAPAQVSVEIVQEQDEFLAGEALPTAVRIRNHSGQTLHLGAEANWLTFAVESDGGVPALKNSDVPVLGEFVLESSKVATKRVDLAPAFALTQPGHYAVTATVRVKDWDQEIASPAKGFDIVQGVPLWEQEFGVPQSPGSSNSAPEVRRYVLQQVSFLRGHLQLYLRLTDATGTRILRVVRMGTMLSFNQPKGVVDKSSNLHVLHQTGAHSFNYAVFNPNGDLVLRQTYDYINSRPRLQMGTDGEFSILGGVRRIAANDVPPPKPAPPLPEPPQPTAGR
jgi:hypothetical protein